VCIFCTPEYARKADAGAGGVGYEKMIVTGELYQNLGSDKFIPILVRGEKEEALPSFLKSRVLIDFRNPQEYGARLLHLLHDLHNVPKDLKPPLGPNPFAQESLRQADAQVKAIPRQLAPVPLTPASAASPESVYETCQSLLRREDMVGWQQFAKTLRSPVEHNLLAWREYHDRTPPPDSDSLAAALDDALGRVMPLIAMALAGVESRMPAFVDQRHVFDDLTQLAQWQRGGRVVLAELPTALGYVYHYLHGATCLTTDQLKIALSLATMSVRPDGGGEACPLWEHHELTGYPRSLGGDCAHAWQYLQSATTKFPWLNRVFARQTDYPLALCAYSLALSALELANVCKSSRSKEALMSQEGKWEFTVVPLYAREQPELITKAFDLVFRDRKHVETVADIAEADPGEMRELWGRWLERVAQAIPPNLVARHQFDIERKSLSRLP
jgi:hypothetical protein